MKNNLPLVSIIIPCRNEEKFIERCLSSLIKQDYPKENLEILVVDGMSEDKTREVVKNYTKKYPFVKLLENPQKFTPFALNLGVKNSKGEIIMLAGAHAVYEKAYISKCLKYLQEYNTDNVGGVLKTILREDTLMAKAIALSLSHPFGAGSSYYRLGSSKPRWVDTVFGGCYKREVFEKIGFFDERLIRSQDIEFNKRLKKAGGKILLFPDIISYYYPSANLKDFLKHNFLDGIWVTYPLKFKIKVFSSRHLIPLFFVSSLIGLILLSFFSKIFLSLFLTVIFFYLLVSSLLSLQIAKKEKDFRYLFLMPIIFASRHLGYGLGSLWGLIKP